MESNVLHTNRNFWSSFSASVLNIFNHNSTGISFKRIELLLSVISLVKKSATLRTKKATQPFVAFNEV